MIDDFEQQRVALSTGVELDVVDLGPKTAPALIFLHGFPESHRTWRHQLRHLSGQYRCIAPDQRGYRGSSKPAAVADYSPDKLVADIFALADALNVQNFTIVGHDWGGAIAWGVALAGQAGGPNPAWAGRVTRAIIANAPHPAIFQRLLLTNADQRAASQYMRVFRDTANDGLIREHGIAGLLIHAFGDRVPSGGVNPPEEIERLRADWDDRDACFGMVNWYRASPVNVPDMDAPYAEPPAFDFPKLGIPTLVIWAMDDMALPPCNLDGIDALIPNLRVAEVARCGHFVPWEAADRVNAEIDQFLAETA